MSNISVIIEGKEFKAWTKVELTRNFDSIDTMAITYPFDSENKAILNLFKPFSYNMCQVLYKGSLVFVGTLLDTVPAINAQSKTETANFYALPGALIDCSANSDRNTLEFKDKSFKSIASELCAPFGIQIKYTQSAQTRSEVILDKIAIGMSEPVFSFLSKIAHTQNLYLSSTADGGLLVRQANPTATALELTEDLPPLLSVNCQYNPRQYFSEITAVTTGTEATSINGRSTVNNKKINSFRPFVFQSVDSDVGGIEKAAKSKIARMFTNSVTYSVGIVGWDDRAGNILSTNKKVILKAPSVRVNSPYAFNVRSVKMTAEPNSINSILELVLLESFTDKIPNKFPWD